MHAGPLGQLFPEASSLVAMAPLLRGPSLKGACARSPRRRGCRGPVLKLQSSGSPHSEEGCCSLGPWGPGEDQADG